MNMGKFTEQQQRDVETLIEQRFAKTDALITRAVIVEAVAMAIRDATEIQTGADRMGVLRQRFDGYDALKTRLDAHKEHQRWADVTVDFYSSFITYNHALTILEG